MSLLCSKLVRSPDSVWDEVSLGWGRVIRDEEDKGQGDGLEESHGGFGDRSILGGGGKKKQRWADIDRLINCKQQQGVF